MGLIREEIEHPTLSNVSLIVDEKTEDEEKEDWEIVSLDISYSSVRTPGEMVELANWLIENAKRITQEYTPEGKKKEK
jgi:hypothetical protein